MGKIRMLKSKQSFSSYTEDCVRAHEVRKYLQPG